MSGSVSPRSATSSPAPDDDRAAALDDVTVRFGHKLVLEHVALDIATGSHIEVRGQNGSGKTTLLRVLAGTCPPNEGHVAAVRPVAYVPALLEPPAVSVRGWLRSIRERRTPADEALELLGFRGSLDRSFRRLSYGNLRKVLLADAFSSASGLVVIDEAREGLDEPGLTGLAGLIDRVRGVGAAVVIADQAAHPVPAGATTLTVEAGAVSTVEHRPDAEATVRFRGPAGRRAELEEHATRLGFERISDGDREDRE